MDDDELADFAPSRRDPGCLVLVLQTLLFVLAVASFGWAFMAGLGPISFVGLAGLGVNIAMPVAVGAAAMALLLLLGRAGSPRR